MWERYAVSRGAVTIVSTAAALRAVLPQHVVLTRLFYLDFEKDVYYHAHAGIRAFVKRIEYQAERELRAIFVEDMIISETRREYPRILPGEEDGKRIQVDLSKLIHRVVVNAAEDATVENVTARLTAANVPIVAEKSRLHGPPRF